MEDKDNILILCFLVFIIGVSFLAVHLKTQKLDQENQQKELIINISENNVQQLQTLQNQITILNQIQENNKQILKNDIENLYSKTNILKFYTDSFDCLRIENNESLQLICK